MIVRHILENLNTTCQETLENCKTIFMLHAVDKVTKIAQYICNYDCYNQELLDKYLYTQLVPLNSSPL